VHGYSVFTLGRRPQYDGNYVNEKKGGNGGLTWPDGSVHEGSWKDSRLQHGLGNQAYADGRNSKGERIKVEPNYHNRLFDRGMELEGHRLRDFGD
jgi:hypothetical protein